MKKIILSCLFIAFFLSANSQTVQWALNPLPSLYDNPLIGLKIDPASNSYVLINSCGCISCTCPYFSLTKKDVSGNPISISCPYTIYGGGIYQSSHGINFTVDSLQNVYLIGTHNGDSIKFGTTIIIGQFFIVKFDVNGNVIWAKPGTGVIEADNNGNSYYTNGTSITKFNPSGGTIWTLNTTGAISIDNGGNVFVTNNLGTTKYNSSGGFVWSNTIGGTSNYIDATGNCYVTNGNAITKRDNFNNPIWVKNFTGALKRISRNGNIYTADGFTYTRYNASGNLQWTFCATTDSINIVEMAFDYSNNLYTAGYFDGDYDGGNNFANVVFCPYTVHAAGPNNFLAKINPLLNSTQQLILIDNSSLHGGLQNCSAFPVEFTNCCNAFNPGNIFTLQLSDSTGSFTSPVSIGSLSGSSGGTITGTLPLNITHPSSGTSGFKIRVASSSPAITSSALNLLITYAPKAAISYYDTTAFCPGGSIILYAAQENNDTYQWQNNFTDIPGATNTNYTATTSGNYSVIRTSATGCSKSSDTTGIKVYAKPSASITANGATHFCTGGSVQLDANTGTNLFYQWKKNNANVGGATTTSYAATATGNYKVVVANINGCTRASNSIAVTGPPAATIVANGLLTFCSGDSVVLSANAGTGYTYQWKKNNTNIAGATNINYTAKTAGTYKAVVTDSYACSKTSNAKTVVVNCKMEAALNDEWDAEVYPNPSNNDFTLTVDNSNDENISLKIYNVIGESTIITGDFKTNNTITFGENLPAGIYFLEIQKGNKTQKIKIVKI
jgi:hypothetical protein